MDNHVIIDFPKKIIVITADDEDSATEVALVNERRNINSNIYSPVTRAIKLGAADFQHTPQLDRIVNQSIPEPPTLVYNGKLPEKDQSPNRTTVEGTKMCNKIYGLFSGNAEDTNNEGKAESVNNPNEYKNTNSATAKGKY
jgi:hypothetical protein